MSTERLEETTHGSSEEPISMALEHVGSRVPDRTRGWEGRDITQLKDLRGKLGLGGFVDAEREIANAKGAQSTLRDLDHELEKLRGAGLDRGDGYGALLDQKRLYEEKLSAIPPEARMTDYDNALASARDKAEMRLSSLEQELGERRADKDPQVKAMRQEVRRLKEEDESRQCEKILGVAEALHLPSDDSRLQDDRKTGSLVYERDHSNSDILIPWKILYVDRRVILQNEGGGEPRLKFADWARINTIRYMTGEKAKELAGRGLAQAPSLEGRAPKALESRGLEGAHAATGQELVGPVGKPSAQALTTFKREVMPRASLGSRLKRWWKSFWK